MVLLRKNPEIIRAEPDAATIDTFVHGHPPEFNRLDVVTAFWAAVVTILTNQFFPGIFLDFVNQFFFKFIKVLIL